jgi:hypothetical protein
MSYSGHAPAGQVADCVAADALVDHLAAAEIRHADKGYDSNAVRRKIKAIGAAPNIPRKADRRWKDNGPAIRATCRQFVML